jgi:hypothetical protein
MITPYNNSLNPSNFSKYITSNNCKQKSYLQKKVEQIEKEKNTKNQIILSISLIFGFLSSIIGLFFQNYTLLHFGLAVTEDMLIKEK